MVLVPYDPKWPRLFEEERAALELVLEPWLEGGIHHIGSTAIPGITAKPIIDMMAGVRDLEEARGAFEPLRRLSYEYAFHRPGTHRFAKPAPPSPPTHHLHLTEPGSDLWRERLAFRDALRADPSLVAEYETLKQGLLEDELRGGPPYGAAAKRSFVARVTREAGVPLADWRLSL